MVFCSPIPHTLRQSRHDCAHQKESNSMISTFEANREIMIFASLLERFLIEEIEFRNPTQRPKINCLFRGYSLLSGLRWRKTFSPLTTGKHFFVTVWRKHFFSLKHAIVKWWVAGWMFGKDVSWIIHRHGKNISVAVCLNESKYSSGVKRFPFRCDNEYVIDCTTPDRGMTFYDDIENYHQLSAFYFGGHNKMLNKCPIEFSLFP